MAPRKLTVGVLFDNVQAADIMGVDLLFNCSHEMVSAVSEVFKVPHLVADALFIEFLYIAGSTDPTMTTSNIRIAPTHTYDTAPRDLDVLLIGGPAPDWRPEGATRYMRETVGAGRVKYVLTTCTGGLWLADSGTVDGREMTANREVLPLAKVQAPAVKWKDQRWVVDGNLWTAGGSQAGLDMVGKFLTEIVSERLAKHAMLLLDVQPDARGQFYADAK